MQDIHDRMPVILTEDAAKLWLDPKNRDVEVLQKLLVEYDSQEMMLHQVSSRVNKPANDDIDIIQKVEVSKTGNNH